MNTHKFGEIMWFFLDILVYHGISNEDLIVFLKYYTLFIPCIFCRVFLKNFLDLYRLFIPEDEKYNQKQLVKDYVWLIHHTVNVKIQNKDSAITLKQYNQKLSQYNPSMYDQKYKNKNIVRFIRVCCDPFYNEEDCIKAMDFISGTMIQFIDFVCIVIKKYEINELKPYLAFLKKSQQYVSKKEYHKLIQWIEINMN